MEGGGGRGEGPPRGGAPPECPGQTLTTGGCEPRGAPWSRPLPASDSPLPPRSPLLCPSHLPLVRGPWGSPGGLMIPPSPQVEDRTEASVAPVPSGCPPGAVGTPAHLSGSCPCSLHLPAPAPPPGLSISGVGMPSPDPEGHLPLLTGTITKLSTKAAGCASQPLVTSVHFC